MVAVRFENIKIIFNGGERDEAAHDQAGNIHKETEIAHVGDQGRVLLRFAGAKLRFEERVELHILAVAFVRFAPQRESIRGVRELRTHAEATTRAPHRSFDN